MIFKQKTLQKFIQIMKLKEKQQKGEKDNATSGYRTRLAKTQKTKKSSDKPIRPQSRRYLSVL